MDAAPVSVLNCRRNLDTVLLYGLALSRNFRAAEPHVDAIRTARTIGLIPVPGR
jgi:hypothetical protein